MFRSAVKLRHRIEVYLKIVIFLLKYNIIMIIISSKNLKQMLLGLKIKLQTNGYVCLSV